MAQVVNFDTLRSLGHASISSSYAAVGTPTLYPARMVKITNNTDGDMLFSVDGVHDMIFVPAASFTLYDFCTNRLHVDQAFVLPGQTQFYVAYSTSPSKNSVYVEVIYGNPQ